MASAFLATLQAQAGALVDRVLWLFGEGAPPEHGARALTTLARALGRLYSAEQAAGEATGAGQVGLQRLLGGLAALAPQGQLPWSALVAGLAGLTSVGELEGAWLRLWAACPAGERAALAPLLLRGAGMAATRAGFEAALRAHGECLVATEKGEWACYRLAREAACAGCYGLAQGLAARLVALGRVSLETAGWLRVVHLWSMAEARVGALDAVDDRRAAGALAAASGHLLEAQAVLAGLGGRFRWGLWPFACCPPSPRWLPRASTPEEGGGSVYFSSPVDPHGRFSS